MPDAARYRGLPVACCCPALKITILAAFTMLMKNPGISGGVVVVVPVHVGEVPD
jgi:hypothetical protein